MVLKENGSLPVALFRNGRMEEMTDNQLFQILSAHFCFLFPTPRSVPYFQLHVLKKKKERKKEKKIEKLSWDLFFFIALDITIFDWRTGHKFRSFVNSRLFSSILGFYSGFFG